MAVKVKWDITGKGDEAWGAGFDQYYGPVPPKGNYVAKVKRMTLGHIKSQGENHGKPRISVLLEIVSGQGANGLHDLDYPYRGAPVWDGLNIIKQQTGRVNGFLHALTDGSDEAKRAIETAFWPPNGPKAEKIDKKNGLGSDVHITQIGKYKIGSPDGECLVRIVTKMGSDLQGNPRAEINNYIPYTGPKPVTGPAASNGVSVDEDEGEDELLDASDLIEGEDIGDDLGVEGIVEDAVNLDDDGPPF